MITQKRTIFNSYMDLIVILWLADKVEGKILFYHHIVTKNIHSFTKLVSLIGIIYIYLYIIFLDTSCLGTVA